MSAAGSVTVGVRADSTQFNTEMVKNQGVIKQFAQSAQAAGQVAAGSMQNAAAQSIILSQGIAGGTQAATRFASAIGTVGTVLRTAFPVFGAFALLEVLEKLANNKFAKAAVDISNGFRAMNLSAETSIDTLKLSTAKMQENIDLLSGKRPNTLAEDLANAALAADKLATSLDADNRKIKELLQQEGIGAFQGMFTNRAGTADVTGSVTSFTQDLAHLGAVYQHAVRTQSPDQAKDLKALEDKRNAAMEYQQQQLKQRQLFQGANVGPNQDANIAILTGFGDTLVDQGDMASAEKANKATAAQQKKLEDAKKYADLQRKAQEQLVDQWRQALGEDKALSEVTVAQEASYWAYRAETVAKGSLSYRKALEEANKAIAHINAESMSTEKDTGRKWLQFGNISDRSLRPSAMDLSRGDTGDMKEQGRAAADYLKSLNAGIALQHQNSDAIAEASIQMDLMTGRINRLGAAQMEAALHAREYRDAISAIDAALENAQSLPEGFDKQSTIAQLTKQRNQATATYQIQSAQDQYNVSTQQPGTAERQALAVMMQNWSNMTGQIVRIMTQGIDSLNDDIVKAMTGHGKASDFGKTFSQAGEGLMKASLQKLEAGVFGKAIGKPDGTQQNPLYTIDAAKTAGVSGNLSPYFRPFFGGQQGQGGSGGGGGGGILGSIFGKLFGGGGGDAAANGASDALGGAAGGIGDALGDAFSGFAGFFAGGGDVLANHPAVVGEGGPEVFVPRTAGRIVPNDQLGGGDSHYHFHVDARGSNDPMAIEAAVRRGVNQSMVGSVHMQHQIRMRTPHGR